MRGAQAFRSDLSVKPSVKTPDYGAVDRCCYFGLVSQVRFDLRHQLNDLASGHAIGPLWTGRGWA